MTIYYDFYPYLPVAADYNPRRPPDRAETPQMIGINVLITKITQAAKLGLT